LAPGKPLPFVFDSGLSDGNLVSTEAAKALGIEPNETVPTDSGGTARIARVPKVRVGGAVLENQPTAVVSMPEAVTSRPGRPERAGFLGAPLLRDAVLCLDYGEQRMRRFARADFTAQGLQKFPMPLRHGLPTIDVDIDGQRATLVVDTGSNAAITLFPAFAALDGVARRYGGFPGGRAEAGAVTFPDGNGFHHVPLVVGAQRLDPAWRIDGLVGSLILSQLEPCLDRDGEAILWQP
ncbi:MAG TPA: pepsin/retropepsin-like aspartic protease family protein, partial [Nevskiaceae bacterium]|nr:pepsin/retropepsin-like aspartic protease family protein [Nevskiaceae bacterium]